MAWVTVHISGFGTRPDVWIGEVQDVGLLCKALGKFAAWKSPRDGSGGRRQSRRGSADGTFGAVYAKANPSTDREFAALVAVFRRVQWQQPTRSRDIQQLAVAIGRPLTNVSVAVADARRKGDLVRIREGVPATYEPSTRAIKAWAGFINGAVARAPRQARAATRRSRSPRR
jgi:hypothetical protein